MAEGGERAQKPEGRPLGAGDTSYQCFVEQLGSGIYMHVAIFHSNKLFEEADIRKALVTLTTYQEALQMRIVHEPDKGKFKYRYEARDDPFDIDLKVCPIANTLDWTSIMEKETTEQLDTSNGPLWRAIYCPVGEQTEDENYPFRFVMMHKSHHAIADSVSVFDMFYRQFLPILSAIANKEETGGIMPVVPLIKSNEELFMTKKQQENGLPWYWKLGLGLYRWKNRKFGVKALPKFCYVEDDFKPEDAEFKPNGTKPFSFDEEMTTAIISSAKTHGVTVHCVLLAANSLALSATAQDAGLPLPKNMRTVWPINLRKYLGWGTPQPLGGVTGAGFTFTKYSSTASEEQFWKLCKKIQSDVKKQTKKGKATSMIGLSQYILDMFSEAPVSECMKELILVFVGSISNIGRCDGGPEPRMSEGEVKIKLVEHHFALLTKQPSDMVPFFHGISTFRGRLLWNMVYSCFSVSSHFVENYVANINKIVGIYCKGI